MARRSSGRSSRPAPRPAARSPPPQKASHAPPPATAQGSSGGSMLGGIGSTIAQGLAFGTGSAMAHRAVDAVMGPRTIQHETVASEAAAAASPTMGGSDACNMHTKAFQDCLNSSANDLSKCQFYMDMLSECRRNSGRSFSSTLRRSPPPHSAPVQSGSGGSMLGGIGSTITQGLAFGSGSTMAHRAVDEVMGRRRIHHETIASEASAVLSPPSRGVTEACSMQSKAFQDQRRRHEQVPVLL